jgi:hypothetical protein
VPNFDLSLWNAILSFQISDINQYCCLSDSGFAHGHMDNHEVDSTQWRKKFKELLESIIVMNATLLRVGAYAQLISPEVALSDYIGTNLVAQTAVSHMAPSSSTIPTVSPAQEANIIPAEHIKINEAQTPSTIGSTPASNYGPLTSGDSTPLIPWDQPGLPADAPFIFDGNENANKGPVSLILD